MTFQWICLLYTSFLMEYCTSQFEQQGVPLQNEATDELQKPRYISTPTFEDVFINSRTIYLSWRTPQIPLRTLLLYGRDEENVKMIELPNRARNHSLETLEPGTSYNVIVKFYYSPSDHTKISKVVTTVPKRADLVNGKLKIEVQLLLKYSSPPSEWADSLQQKVKDLLSGFQDIESIEVYPLKRTRKGHYVTIYIDGVGRYDTQKIFYLLRDSLASFNADHIGFSYRLYSDCCQPLLYHSFNHQQVWSGDSGLHIRIIQDNSFHYGKCHLSLNNNRSETIVSARKSIVVDMLTFSVYVNLWSINGLHPIISASSKVSQLRLEIREGKLVWLFYNLIKRKGFMLSTKAIIQAGEWNHILADYDSASGVSRLFINGEMKEKGVSHVKLGGRWMDALKVGKYFSGGLDYKLKGYLDELHIFSCLLTLKDIKYISNSCGKFRCDYEDQLEDSNESSKNKDDDDKFDNDVDSKVMEQTKKCHPAGTQTDNSLSNSYLRSSTCQCKANVEGELCDRCKKGTFYLNEENEEGCIKCFCNDLSNECRSATIYRKQIVLGAQDISHLNLRTLDGTSMLQSNFLYNPLTNAVSFKSFQESDQGKMFYWELPLRYCGDKVTSYGGNLRYTILYLSQPHDNPVYDADVVLIGNGKELLYSEGEDPLPGQQYHYQVILDERFWRHPNGAEVTREELIAALANIESFLLRAMFSTDMIETSLYEVRLDIAGYDQLASNNKALPMVEQCTCPPEYFGTSCQHCNTGYKKIKNSNNLGQCERCSCNGHANDCDGKTGECRDCQHHTTGMYCEKCAQGYFGDPTSGSPHACKPCSCPFSIQSNMFSPTCFTDRDGQQTCDACMSGYIGRRCDRCAPGYYGNPNIIGDTCKKAAALSDTVLPAISIFPESREDYINTVASFNCTVSGPQATSITWTRANRQLLPDRAKVISDGNTRILLLRNLQLSDDGQYICTSKNYFGTSSKKSVLIVKGGTLERIRIRASPKTIITEEGRTATFHCEDDSISDSKIKWSGDNGLELPKEAIVNERYLTIPRVKRRHSGLYVCTGSNRYSIDKATVHLRVRTRRNRKRST